METSQDPTPKGEGFRKFRTWLHEETTLFQPSKDGNVENCIDPSLRAQCIALFRNFDLMDLVSVKPVKVTLVRVSGQYYAEYRPTSSSTIMLPIGTFDSNREQDPREIMTPGFPTHIQTPIWVAPGMECIFIDEYDASERLEFEKDDGSDSSTIVDLEGLENGDPSTDYKEDGATIAEREFGKFDTMADLGRLSDWDSSDDGDSSDDEDTDTLTDKEFEDEFGILEDLENEGLGVDFLDDDSQMSLDTPGQSSPIHENATQESQIATSVPTPAPSLVPESPPNIKFWLPALLVSEFIINLDVTLQITALSTMSSSFNALDRASWIGTAFFIGVITATLFLPLLTQIFGKKTIVISYHLFYLLGAFISSFANLMQDLSAGRAIQGMGAGGSVLMVFSIMEDTFESKENGTSWKNLRFLFSAIAIALGPLLSAAISDRIGWRWIYRFQLPFIVTALLTLLIFFPNLKSTPEAKIPIWKQIFSYNIPGSLSLVSATVLFYIDTLSSTTNTSSLQTIVLAHALGAGLGIALYSLIVQTTLKSKIRLSTSGMTDRARQSLAFIGSGDSKEVAKQAYAAGVSRGLWLGIACIGVDICAAIWLVCKGRMGTGEGSREPDGNGEKEDIDVNSNP
ncbi:hypothetical protein B7494_g5094 [Chlorociboria aeruginascens]|nr:hypothetical protein B7494_g5094 [Chlorociboria aeruginascens]